MCGIYGAYDYKRSGLTAEDLRRMGDVLRRRGPDDRGSYADDTVMLGHNRLSIIDLSPAGRQPMRNEDGSVWVAYNGEIYNFAELRNSLKEAHKFKSKSDTEVLIHCYEEMGEALWERLEGMFAFCLWDKKKRVFYLARDHYGIKPLYYCESNGSLLFASQIKGILAAGAFTPRYNYQSVSNFLSYFYVPSPETVVSGIKQVPPGGFLKTTPEGVSLKNFSRMKFDINESMTEGRLIEEIPEKVRESVKKSIVSDVPVGLLLSGGMDSNILLAEMSDIYPDKIKTFTLGVNESSYDESGYARDIALRYGSEHYNENFSLENFDSMLTDIVRAADNLNANPGSIMFYQFLRLASKYVKVAVAGSGGDELFAGYDTYLADAAHKYFRHAPDFLKKVLLKGVGYMGVGYKKYSKDYVLRRFIEGSFYSREKAHYWWRNIFTDGEKRRIFKPGFIEDEVIKIDSSYKYVEMFSEIDGSFENRALHADFRLFLADNALILLDHLSMHFSLEVRPPLLYQRFVDYSLTIPYKFKFKPTMRKYILRKSYEKRLPADVISRKKHGVVAPLGLVFKNELRPYVEDILSLSNVKRLDFLDPEGVGELVKRHMDGREDNGYKLWCLMCLLRWDEIFMKKSLAD